jgi:hypothetical protein
LDSSVSSTNTGNMIIMEAVRKVVEEVFPHAFIYTAPLMEYINFGREVVRLADVVFVGGTNALSSDMNARGNWRMRLRDLFVIRNTILLGVGWWQYQDRPLSWATNYRLKHVLSSRYRHWTRDSYTTAKLNAIGVKSLNCGCPTLIPLTAAHCAEIPATKGRSAVITFTDYFSDRMEIQKTLWDVVKKNYSRVFFWPQAYHDHFLAAQLCRNQVQYLPPSLYAFDRFLEDNHDVDFVGTRLHGGVRALQHKRRTIIVGMDNRATEMGRDFNLPVVPTEDLAATLDLRINLAFPTRIHTPTDLIAKWSAQFSDLGKTARSQKT